MANAKSKFKTEKQRDPLPEHFESLEAAAEFWDTHDSGDYQEYMKEVECAVEIKRRTFLVALDGELYQKVRVLAEAKGMQAETLVNLWVEEKAS